MRRAISYTHSKRCPELNPTTSPLKAHSVLLPVVWTRSFGLSRWKPAFSGHGAKRLFARCAGELTQASVSSVLSVGSVPSVYSVRSESSGGRFGLICYSPFPLVVILISQSGRRTCTSPNSLFPPPRFGCCGKNGTSGCVKSRPISHSTARAVSLRLVGPLGFLGSFSSF